MYPILLLEKAATLSKHKLCKLSSKRKVVVSFENLSDEVFVYSRFFKKLSSKSWKKKKKFFLFLGGHGPASFSSPKTRRGKRRLVKRLSSGRLGNRSEIKKKNLLLSFCWDIKKKNFRRIIRADFFSSSLAPDDDLFINSTLYCYTLLYYYK